MWIPPVHSPFSASHAFGALGAGPHALHALSHRLKEFEAPAVSLTDSGTHALQLALEIALAVTPLERASVALPAFTCFDVATAALGVGAPVVFYDVDPASLTPDRASLERAVADGAGIVVVGNLFGFPLDWDALDELRADWACTLIEDAAQGLGTAWNDRPGGSCGDLTVLSFGRGKGWTGSGGGAVLLRGDFERRGPRGIPTTPERRASLAARALSQWLLGRPTLYGIPARLPGLGLGETRFRDPTPPAGMHAYQAGLLLRSEAAARAEIGLRADQRERLLGALEDLRGLVFPRPLPGGTASHLRLPARAGNPPAELPSSLRRLGVYRSYPKALPDLPALGRLTRVSSDTWPGARSLARTLLTLPTHSRSGGASTAVRIRQAMESLGPV